MVIVTSCFLLQPTLRVGDPQVRRTCTDQTVLLYSKFIEKAINSDVH
jgi:hypothetical protein